MSESRETGALPSEEEFMSLEAQRRKAYEKARAAQVRFEYRRFN